MAGQWVADILGPPFEQLTLLSRPEPRAGAYRRLSQWMRTHPHHA